MRRTLALLFVSLGLVSFHAGDSAPAAENDGVFLTKEEALALAFKGCEVERTTFYLTKEQRARAKKLAGFDVGTSIVHAYVARRAGELVGTAWMDTSKVRSKKQMLMVVVDPKRRIARIELLAFAEPLEYIPRDNWYAQFVGKHLDSELSLKRSIKGVTGATLTARATTRAARRLLALHAVAFPVADEAITR